MAPTPSSKSNQGQQTMPRTPQSKHRLIFPTPRGTPIPKESQPSDHPVEVIGRIRTHPERKEKSNSAFQVNPDRRMIRVRADFGYRDFTLDGISSCEGEDLDSFYNKFVKERINGVKMGNKCTIMMYGPTGSGKSHTMFGCSKQPGIVYNSLKDILGEDDQNDAVVQVTVLEIYNEDVYDLLSSSNNGGFIAFSKTSTAKAKLEVLGKKAKNATSISGNEAAKISKEIQKVEKRRIVKNTLCNERSSRSHCLITLDVPAVGGRLMLVDMAGSENIEQAGQVGFEAKMQTGKINQGNIALRRVVESIANGDSHVPFRDSKLTMLLQDSFEDDKSKILMILCASPDIKEIHKTISTLEYGAKAKCIVRGPHTPVKDKNGGEESSSSSAVVLFSRIAAMDQFISKLQMENKLREKERNDAQKELMEKEEEVARLRSKVEAMENRASGLKEDDDVSSIKIQLQKKMEDCERKTNEFIEVGKRRMEKKIFLQQQELEILRIRLEEIEAEVSHSFKGSRFAEDQEAAMVKSMELDLDEPDDHDHDNDESVPVTVRFDHLDEPVGLSTVFEEDEEEDDKENVEEEVKKEVIEEKMISSCRAVKNHDPAMATGLRDALEKKHPEVEQLGEAPEDTAISRRMRIQNIFTLCGNYRELSQRMRASPLPNDDLKSMSGENMKSKSISGENMKSADEKKRITTVIEEDDPARKANPRSSSEEDEVVEVYVKWEASKENPGKFVTTLKVAKDSSLSDLRKLIEIHLGSEKQAFTFLVLGDPSGNHVPKEKEATIKTMKLPVCNNQLRGLVACLRLVKDEEHHRLPLRSMENKLPRTPKSCVSQSDCFSPEFIAVRRY